MNSPVLSRTGAACGAVFAVVLFVAVGNGDAPFSGPRAVASLAALTLAIPFLAYICSLLRSAGRAGDQWLVGTAAGTGIAWAALKLSSGAGELAIVRGHTASGSSLHSALAGIADGVTVISLYPLAICCAAVAVAAWRSRALPRWLAGFAGVTAVALAVNGGFLTTGNVPAMVVFILWSLVASGYLLWRAQRGTSAAPATSPDRSATAVVR